ncbi:starch synthase [Monoraphidium neglectum]|uniref:Starch synthase, chloroplastic/amyloplastic n=1 Tax=Monoraphidium neglectum TaxID=145388 RepID=A0A0D2JEF8_9CHLO|nr:starch synthase [Monoraphidium neglectum]KIY97962.1 starch synthase [Monoraphidium neglectum]|eukprot:XP_013896982.1 starch synthase [Monoraphidium neglectum]
MGPSAWGRPVLEPLEPLAPRAPQGTRKTRPRVTQCTEPLSIVFCAAEVAPWSKTGGLGDVMGALPQALAARGHRVTVVTARHTNGGADVARYDGAEGHAPAPRAASALAPCNALTPSPAAAAQVVPGGPLHIELGGGRQAVELHRLEADGVEWLFVDHPVFQRPGTPYGDANGPFEDNLFRFALLSLAALEAPLRIAASGGRSLGDDVTFIANDWHAALLPVFLRSRYQEGGAYRGATCALAIHNLAHQGVFPSHAFNGLSLPGGTYGLLEWRPPPGPGEDPNNHREATLNVLKGGVECADSLITVSQNYALEITSSPQPQGIHTLLAQRRALLRGIVNGIDTREWDPSSDPLIPANYSAQDLAGKAACKRALQRELRLEPDPRAPLVGFVGRLDHQKGPDLVLESLPALAALGCQVVMLGSGAPDYEAALQEATKTYGFFFRAVVGFSVPLAHRLMAGCDILLMPSRFEPCGLNQLYAMRYGTVPVAHATGGLADTIDDVSAFDGGEEGTGWTFSPATLDALAGAVAAAVRCYRSSPAAWGAVVRRGMAADHSWEGAAEQYEKVLLGAKERRLAAAV